MNHPATRDPLGSRSPGCCYHSWNPQVYPPCRVCLRPVLTLQQQCPMRASSVATSVFHQPAYQHSHISSLTQTPFPGGSGAATVTAGTPCHEHLYYPQQSRSAETTPTPFNRFDWRSSSATATSSTNPRYHTHPPPRSAGSRSPPLTQHHHHHHHYHHPHNRETRDDSSIGLGRCTASSSFAVTSRPLVPPALEPTHRWIGEETKRSLPSHVYKYYLAHTKEYRRQNQKVR